MADQNRRQKSMSESALRVRQCSQASAADLPIQVPCPHSLCTVSHTNNKVDLAERIASLRRNSLSQDTSPSKKSRKRAAEYETEDDPLPKKKHKSAAARVIAKVMQTVYDGSAIAYTTYQACKDKLKNQITYRTSWQPEPNIANMRGHGIDFLRSSDSPTAFFTKDSSSSKIGVVNETSKRKESSEDSPSNASKTSTTGPVVDSENWYWVTRDLRVTVIPNRERNRSGNIKLQLQLPRPRRRNIPVYKSFP